MRMASKGKKHLLFTAAGGLAVGLINGLLGAGGGMLAVPILAKAGLSQREAHAGSLAVILPLSLFRAAFWARRWARCCSVGFPTNGSAGSLPFL